MKKPAFLIATIITASMASAQEPADRKEVYFSRDQTEDVLPVFEHVIGSGWDKSLIAPGNLFHKIVDLDGDGVNEIMFRYTRRNACSEMSCPIIIAGYDGVEWRKMVELMGFRIEIDAEAESGGLPDLYVWTEFTSGAAPYRYISRGGRYAMDLSMYGDELELTHDEDMSMQVSQALSLTDPILAARLRSLRNEDDKILVGQVDLNGDGDMEIVTRIEHAAACGGAGCDLLVFDRLDLGAAFSMKSLKGSQVVVRREGVPDGALPDFLLERSDGVARYIWDAELQAYKDSLL